MPIRNFDEERKAKWHEEGLTQFVLGGETFTMRPVIDPIALARYDEMEVDIGNMAALELLDDVMVEMILPSETSLWREARARKVDDLPKDATVDQIIEASAKCIDLEAVLGVLPWLIEKATGGLPTEAPSDSLDGREQSSTPSMESSPSDPAPTSERSISVVS